MPSPNGVITVEGSFEQAYCCDQDCGPAGSGRVAGRTMAKGEAPVTTMLDRLSFGKARNVAGGYDGTAGPSIQGAQSPEGANLIEASSDHSLLVFLSITTRNCVPRQ